MNVFNLFVLQSHIGIVFNTRSILYVRSAVIANLNNFYLIRFLFRNIRALQGLNLIPIYEIVE